MATSLAPLSIPRSAVFDRAYSAQDHRHRLTEDQWNRLDQRRLWLRERIKAKQLVGWETVYDQSEHDALEAALPLLRYFVQ